MRKKTKPRVNRNAERIDALEKQVEALKREIESLKQRHLSEPYFEPLASNPWWRRKPWEPPFIYGPRIISGNQI